MSADWGKYSKINLLAHIFRSGTCLENFKISRRYNVNLFLKILLQNVHKKQNRKYIRVRGGEVDTS